MFKPMLAPGEDPKSFPDYFKKIKYPLLCSPKYDGIRCVIKSGKCLSRSGKILPSFQVQDEFSHLRDLDGEIIEGNATDFDVYNRTQSHVMSEDKPGNLTFFVFDYTHTNYLSEPFYSRLEEAEKILSLYEKINVKIVEHEYVETYEELIAFENKCLELGFEGIMMRDPLGRYKNGRGTFREGLIYKLKRFQDAEGIVVDFKEQMINNNTLEKDELGYAKRSTAKEGLTNGNTLGGFVLRFNEMEIDVAPGVFSHIERKQIWDNREAFKGTLLKFRFFAHGIKDKPRFPRAIGFRDEIDL